MLGRIKSLQQRLDVILGKVGSKRKDVYDSKQSLASRIVKVERSVEDIESKLDLLIDLYKEDRKPLLQHCQDCSQQNNMPVEHNQMEVTSCLKNPIIPKPTTPRSILFDKHCPKRQRSASVDSADTGLCDTKNHTEEVSENEDQPIIIKDPPPPKKNFPDYMVKKVQTKIRNALQNQKYRW
eukprot:XP_011443188.1 PREDICTED: uncharacterized protein LOC105339362 [Crassostrea gigas]